MKRLISLCAILALTIGIAAAEPKPKAKSEVVTTCFITSIDCEGCTKKVMNTIPFEKGVKDVKVDLKKKEILVSYDKSKNNPEAIIAKLKRLDIKAEVK
ncbi:MAG: cation transporter [Rikenellaceae bacterium]